MGTKEERGTGIVYIDFSCGTSGRHKCSVWTFFMYIHRDDIFMYIGFSSNYMGLFFFLRAHRVMWLTVSIQLIWLLKRPRTCHPAPQTSRDLLGRTGPSSPTNPTSQTSAAVFVRFAHRRVRLSLSSSSSSLGQSRHSTGDPILLSSYTSSFFAASRGCGHG